jgi:hypothetical protein
MIRYSTATRQETFDEWALSGVIAVWAVMVGTMPAWVALYGYNVPQWEDWLMVPALVGKQPHLLQWLWSQYLEHRLPLAKAIYLVLLRASDGDVRIAMIANTLMLSILCLAMILMARRLRGGQTRLADAFFPLVLLHLGHVDNILFGWQINYVISTSLACVWLLIVVGGRWPLSARGASAAGLTLVLLPLSGAYGMIFTPFVALWLLVGTLLYHDEMTARWMTPFQITCVVFAIAVMCLYFVGYEQPAAPSNPGIVITAITAARFVGMSLGPVGAGTSRVFPASVIGVFFCGVACLLWASAIILLSRGLGNARSAERFRVIGFLTFAAATAALVLLLGWGRAGSVPFDGMPSRYALLSVPGLCAAYFAWILYGPDGTRDRVMMVFALAVLLALPFNLRHGLGHRDGYVASMRAFEQNVAKGMSWRELADRQTKGWRELAERQGGILWWDPERDAKGIEMLHDAKMGPWKNTP